MPRRVPREHSDRPLQGFKLAYPMLSADGTRAGFSGVTVGRGHVYLVPWDHLTWFDRHGADEEFCFHTAGAPPAEPPPYFPHAQEPPR